MKNEPLTARELIALLPRLQATVELATRYLQFREPLELLVGGQAGRVKLAAAAVHLPRRMNRREQSEHLRQDILGHLGDRKDGMTTSELAEGLGVAAWAVSYSLNRLRREKQVRMTGNRRTARWHASA